MRLHRLEEGLLAALMGVLVLLTASQILLRALFLVTLPWADPLIRHLVLWTGFLGAMVACRLDKHIRIDALLRLSPPRWSGAMEAAGSLFAAGVCALLVWLAIQFVANERSYGTASFWDVPTWTLQLIFPLAFGVMAVRFLRRGISRIRQLLGGDGAS